MLTWFPQNLLHIHQKSFPPRRSLWSAMQSACQFPLWSYKCILNCGGNYWGSLEKWVSQIRLYSLPCTLLRERSHRRKIRKDYTTKICSKIHTSFTCANVLGIQQALPKCSNDFILKQILKCQRQILTANLNYVAEIVI